MIKKYKQEMKNSDFKIAVAGTGYVGMSMAVLLSQYNSVTAVDVIPQKVDMINNRVSPIEDSWIEQWFETMELDLHATLDGASAYKDADYVIIAVPTNYDEEKQYFDTHHIEEVIDLVRSVNTEAVMIIKSTIPIGYCRSLYKKYGDDLKLLFSPEFLREGRALYDSLHPSRIIVGYPPEDISKDFESLNKHAITFAEILKKSAEDKCINTLIMGIDEAESVKLFANTYLAMRCSYFNELDTFAEVKGLNAKDIILGVSMDPRIGEYYNNPSFGYGGYCLPKDTKQMVANYKDIPQELMSAIVKSNETRKNFIVSQVLNKGPHLEKAGFVLQGRGTIGVYKLAMKSGSDNFRQSAILYVMDVLRGFGYDVIVYEPSIDKLDIYDLENDLEKFKEKSDIILANRLDMWDLKDVMNKVYSRDVFGRD